MIQYVSRFHSRNYVLRAGGSKYGHISFGKVLQSPVERGCDAFRDDSVAHKRKRSESDCHASDFDEFDPSDDIVDEAASVVARIYLF
jgi:hypothetical protein